MALASTHPALADTTATSFFAASTTPATEPANALSLPTWAIHVSSVVEWLTAMGLFVKLGSVRNDPALAGMAWGMLPLLGGALAACTFHFFYNAPSLYPMVAAQAGLTVLGNATLALAAYRLWASAKEEEDGKKSAAEAAAAAVVEKE